MPLPRQLLPFSGDTIVLLPPLLITARPRPPTLARQPAATPSHALSSRPHPQLLPSSPLPSPRSPPSPRLPRTSRDPSSALSLLREVRRRPSGLTSTRLITGPHLPDRPLDAHDMATDVATANADNQHPPPPQGGDPSIQWDGDRMYVFPLPCFTPFVAPSRLSSSFMPVHTSSRPLAHAQVQYLHIRLLPQTRVSQDRPRTHERGSNPAYINPSNKR